MYLKDFLGIKKKLKIHGSAQLSWPHKFVNKVQPNKVVVLNFNFSLYSQPNKVQLVIPFNTFWKFFKARNSSMGVFGS